MEEPPAVRTLPITFDCGGHTVTVTRKAEVDNGDSYGLCLPERQEIEVQRPKPGITADFLLQTFCHELVHYILHQMGEERLYHNERFVDGFGHLLHQFFKTKRHS